MRCIQVFVSGERDYLEDPSLDGRILSRRIFKKWFRGMEWIGVAMDMDRWRAVVNAVKNLRVQKMRGNS
jgi:predicted double-glycine peptidase